jgi:hypothetical protein
MGAGADALLLLMLLLLCCSWRCCPHVQPVISDTCSSNYF